MFDRIYNNSRKEAISLGLIKGIYKTPSTNIPLNETLNCFLFCRKKGKFALASYIQYYGGSSHGDTSKRMNK